MDVPALLYDSNTDWGITLMNFDGEVIEIDNQSDLSCGIGADYENFRYLQEKEAFDL